ncbi:hypothetical protein FACS1894158_05820 [Betaproteobacteria bacterium]|nr:hypothetical protein FACS1894158_05820 [Betaproteobacteria bacterium]
MDWGILSFLHEIDKPQCNSRNASARKIFVPFALWMSPEWKKTHHSDFASMLDRPYSNARFIHTWSDLAGLRYDPHPPLPGHPLPQAGEGNAVTPRMGGRAELFFYSSRHFFSAYTIPLLQKPI